MTEQPTNRIREYRQKKGFSLRRLAEKMGVHFTTLGKLESGKMGLTLDWAIRIGEALEVDFSNLMRADYQTEPYLPIRKIGHGLEWSSQPIIYSTPRSEPSETQVFVQQRDLKNAPAEKLRYANPPLSGALLLVESDFYALIDGMHYVFTHEKDYYLGIYRDMPPRFVQPLGWEPELDLRLGPNKIEVIGLVMERVEFLFHSDPDNPPTP